MKLIILIIFIPHREVSRWETAMTIAILYYMHSEVSELNSEPRPIL